MGDARVDAAPRGTYRSRHDSEQEFPGTHRLAAELPLRIVLRVKDVAINDREFLSLLRQHRCHYIIRRVLGVFISECNPKTICCRYQSRILERRAEEPMKGGIVTPETMNWSSNHAFFKSKNKMAI